MPVGGSRHYRGAGLGQVGMWACPSCGEDNTGVIEQGCVHCGAGVPKVVAPPSTPPPPPRVRVSERTPDDPTYRAGHAEQARGGIGEAWAVRYPEASLADAYEAGYRDGVRAAQAARESPPPPREDVIDAKTYRTMIAALSLFRDQVLASRPEETTTGEWLSADEASLVIAQLTDMLMQLRATEPEVAHAV